MIIGAYEVGPEVGVGGMGAVHLAHDRMSGAAVALKRIHQEFAEQKPVLRRFAIEIQTAARLRHANIVSVIDCGTEPRGTPYCVMEWVSGRALTYWARAQPPWECIAWIVSDLLDALAYAHARGVVHRDLKPANILIESPFQTPRVRLVDFGIARLLEPAGDDLEATALTLNDRVIGTPAYLSPEQAQAAGHLTGPHTDLYSLGVILYELISGALPFNEASPVKTLLAHLSRIPPALDINARPDVPRAVIAAVRWMLEKHPDDRPQSAQEVREALELGRDLPRVLLPKREELEEFYQIQDDGYPTHHDAADILTVDAAAVSPPMPPGGLDSLPMVARDDELAGLLAQAEAALAGTRAHLMLLHGPAGIGKSRLARETRYALAESGSFRSARLLCQGGRSLDEALRVLIARLLLAERLTGQPLRERLETVARRYQFNPAHVNTLAAWLGQIDLGLGVEAPVNEHLDLAALIIRKIAYKRPLVLILEGLDSDSAEDSSRSLPVAKLIAALFSEEGVDATVFALATSRSGPDALPKAIAEVYLPLKAKGLAGSLELTPLDDGVLADLIRPLAGLQANYIATRAAGNPLFAVELARYRAGLTVVPGQDEATMPLSVVEVWKRRIERAIEIADRPKLCRSVLVAAALLGPSIQRRRLVAVVAEGLGEDAEAAESAIDHWTAAEVLRDDGERNPAVSFVHTLAYENIGASLTTELDDVTVRLLRHAGDLALGNQLDLEPPVLERLSSIVGERGEMGRALDLRLLAGELLCARLEMGSARAAFEKVIEESREARDRAREVRATAQLANVHLLLGNVDAAAHCLEAINDPTGVGVEAAIGHLEARANLCLARGEAAQAAALLGQAVEVAERTGGATQQAKVRTELARALELAGDLPEAERQCRTAVSVLDQADAPMRLRARAYISLASLCRGQGRSRQALEAAKSALDMAEAVGARREVLRSLEELVELRDDGGELSVALTLAERMLEQQRDFGDTLGQIRTWSLLGRIQCHAGHLDSAETHYRTANERLRALTTNPDQAALGGNLLELGIVYRRMGQEQKAGRHFDEALGVLWALDERGDVSAIHAEIGLMLRHSAPKRAEDLLQSAQRCALDRGDLRVAGRCQLGLGLLAVDRNNWSIARELFSEARSAAATMGLYRDRITAEAWLALSEAHQGNTRTADMSGRDIAEALDDKPVFRRSLASVLALLADSVEARDSDVALNLRSRARAIEERLSGRKV
jgi:tetratricopeptide (TPR) repeat protein